jgi:hypothetical protein
MKSLIQAIVMGSVALLSSCGGGSGSGVSAVPPVTGYVIDSPVEGLSYTCGALTGTTGSDGSFLHDSGAACTFKIGNVTVGTFNSAPTDGVVTPHDLAGVSRGDSLNTSAVAIAQFLQSLDDGSGSGKIKIPSSVVTALSSVPAQKIVDGTTTLTQSTLTNLVSTATGNTKTLVSAATAGAAMNSYIQTKYPDLDVKKGSAATSTSSSSSSSTTNVAVPAPKLSSPPPSSLTVVLNSVGLTATTDVASVGYYVVLPVTASAPNKWQIVAGTDDSNKSVSLSGSFNLSAGAAATQTISGLSFNTEYKVYFVAANAAQTSKTTDVVTSTVSTGAEPKAPVLSSTFPITLTPSNNTTTFSVTTDVSGTGYWVVLPIAATAPTASQVIAGKDSLGTSVSLSGSAAFTGGTSRTYSITGLAYQTAYKLYFVASNALDTSKVTAVNSADLKAEGTVPALSGTFPNSLTPTNNATSFSVTTDVSGTGYWVVLPSTATAPTVAQIIAGKDSSGATVTLSGNANLNGGTSKTFSITSLSYQTAYKLYFLVVNAVDTSKSTAINMSDIQVEYAIPVLSNLTVLMSTGLSGGGLVQPTGFGTAFQFTPNVDIKFYWVILPKTSKAPSLTQILEGKDSSSNPVTLSGNTTYSSGQEAIASVASMGALQKGNDYAVYFVAVNASDATKYTSYAQLISDPYASGNNVTVCTANC